jgi:hypothetical protein
MLGECAWEIEVTRLERNMKKVAVALIGLMMARNSLQTGYEMGSKIAVYLVANSLKPTN